MIEMLTASIYEGLFDSNSQSDTHGQQSSGQGQPPPEQGIDEKIRKFTLYNKLKNLNKRLVDFKNTSKLGNEISNDLDSIFYTINVIIKFYDLFSVQDVEKMGIEIAKSVDIIMKKVKHHKKNKENKTEEVLRAEL